MPPPEIRKGAEPLLPAMEYVLAFFFRGTINRGGGAGKARRAKAKSPAVLTIRQALPQGPAARGGRWNRFGLFLDLTADFAGFVGLGVDVDVPAAGQQIGSLRVGQRLGAFERALGGRPLEDWHHHAGILAGLGRPVEVRGGGRAGQARITA